MPESVVFKGTPIHYRTSGSGPWVVLLHGFLESMEIWDSFARDLEPRFSVLQVDLPGHGRSGVIADVHEMRLMAEAVMTVADQKEINRFTVCGHSMGGYAALELASMYPDRVNAVALLHSHAAPDDEDAKEARRRTINIVKLNHSGFINQFIPELFAPENRERLAGEIEILRNRAGSTSAKSVIAALEGMKQRAGSLVFLSESPVPVCFVIGRNDSRMPYNKVIAQSMMCPHAEILLLDKVGHMGFLEAPEKVFPFLKDFFVRNIKD